VWCNYGGAIDSPCECEHNNPVVSIGVCYTAVDAAAGGLTSGWWAVVLECFSSHPVFARRFRQDAACLLPGEDASEAAPGIAEAEAFCEAIKEVCICLHRCMKIDR